MSPSQLKVIGEAAQSGDWLAVSAIARAANFIGVALADLLHIFNPSAIIIGGGVSRTGPLLLEPMFTTNAKSCHEPWLSGGFNPAPGGFWR